MRRKQFVVHGTVFPTKAAVTAHVRRVLHGYRLGDRLREDDFLFMCDLISTYHPEAESKIGCGVKAVYVDTTEYNGRGFYLERLDGTTTDFSFLKCLSPPTPWQEFVKASREAVRADIEAFRSAAFSAGRGAVVCPYLGTVLTPGTCHVDHKPPKTFARLLADYIAAVSLNWEELKIRPTRDNNQVTEFEDGAHAAAWRAWHGANCDLRVVSRLANLSHVKRESGSGT